MPAEPLPSAPGAGAPLEDQARNVWERDAGLRAEFAEDFDAFLAYRKAEAAGRARLRAVN